jgi:hypothetical protein
MILTLSEYHRIYVVETQLRTFWEFTFAQIRKRNRVHKKAKFRNLASDWESFRRIRNEIIDMIRVAKKQYIIKLQNSLIYKI